MTAEISLLKAHVRSRHPVEFEAIARHRNALSTILIEFWFDGGFGRNQRRVYEVKRSPANAYRSLACGGQLFWTEDPQGPDGKPVVKAREWVVSEGNGYIGSFETLEDVAVMILHQLEGRDVFVVSDTEIFPGEP